MKNEINRIAGRLVKAFKTNTVINPIPVKYCKNINLANKLRKLCEDQIKDETIGIKAGGTGIQALKKLKENKEVMIPTYDFSTHSRKKDKQKINPKKIILVDGILILNSKELVDIFDLKIFIDVPDKIRLERRMFRDINERERTADGVINQWEKQVLPMHKKYVETSAKFANIISN